MSSDSPEEEPHYSPVAMDQVRDALTAMRALLDQETEDTVALVTMKKGRWFERVAYSSADERAALAAELYALASGRQADLALEVPEIMSRIRYEYRPAERFSLEVRETIGAIDLIRQCISEQLARLGQEPSV